MTEMDLRGPFSSACPTRTLIDLIANKWTMLVLMGLGQKPMRFNELKRVIEGVSQKVLTQTVRKLERNGLISRTVLPTVPVNVTYALTPLGVSLAEMMIQVRGWSLTHIADILAAQQNYDAIAENHSA
ncbi:helix-turn-helix domain-containing protein [Lonsdalea britannica]|uniref:winged helix-turn-helix transcriptional regulator n=1 Tax=Lonsdalea britannica TaxID=1082704 RepID=UPI0026F1704C|nr:helix-turn-helix domain-containing protein [Lonsdalea britannica]